MSTGQTGFAGGTKLPTRVIKYCCSARHWATESRIIIRPGFSRRRSRFITHFAGILDQLDLSAFVHADRDVLGLRQFLLRGLDKVRSEWLWACTAFNLRKLMMAIEKLRAGGSLELV